MVDALKHIFRRHNRIMIGQQLNVNKIEIKQAEDHYTI